MVRTTVGERALSGAEGRGGAADSSEDPAEPPSQGGAWLGREPNELEWTEGESELGRPEADNRQVHHLLRISLGGDPFKCFPAEGLVHVEAQFVDFDGNTSETARVDGLATLPEYGIVGYLQPGEAGLYAGLDVEGQLVLVDRSGGQRQPVSGMTPVGVHAWEGKLWLVGHNGGNPLVAEIDVDGDVGRVEDWDASREAGSDLGSRIEVLDDRALPTREITWDGPRNALGPAIFVSPHRLDHHADGTTTWLVAGPDFQSGGEARTAIAYAPVGVSYP